MKHGLYPKLALDGMRKNRRLYLPYLLTCGGMVMMFYILAYLVSSDSSSLLPYQSALGIILNLGCGVIAVFAAIFLFYTNSFLMRRRKKEFGLYNILGMDKRNLGRVIFWENLFTALIALAGGLAAGIAFSKLAELGLLNIMQMEVNYDLTLSPKAALLTLKVFGVIFLLIFLNALRQIRFTGTLALLRSETEGEKPPKANWLLGVLGAVILGAAYYIAVVVADPVSALMWFFIAVILVIAATYLLMIFGSVLLCRILQKNKGYYYKASHFVSLSSMTYRMKRNGAGLASVCILATMVLVMISSTACLYFGSEGAIQERYPREMNIEISFYQRKDLDKARLASLHQDLLDVAKGNGVEPFNLREYPIVSNVAYFVENKAELAGSEGHSFSPDAAAQVNRVQLMALSDYNAISGTNESLEDGEALIHSNRESYPYDDLTLITEEGKLSFRVREVSEGIPNRQAAMNIIPTVTLVVPDLSEASELLEQIGVEEIWYDWEFGFDTGLSPAEQISLCETLRKELRGSWKEERGLSSLILESREMERQDFYTLYGGLFYLGILLSIVFLFAAVLILYYKQISEGYEDRGRFDIMQKVGMNREEIRKSVNSQLLTVFFLPLLMAGVHLCFAFPMVQAMLKCFNLVNADLFIKTTALSFGVFALFYVIVYRITSNAYYHIVSGDRGDLR